MLLIQSFRLFRRHCPVIQTQFIDVSHKLTGVPCILMRTNDQIRDRIDSPCCQISFICLLAVNIKRQLISRWLTGTHEHDMFPYVRTCACPHCHICRRNICHILSILPVQKCTPAPALLEKDRFPRCILLRRMIHPQTDREIFSARIERGGDQHPGTLSTPCVKMQDASHLFHR